MTQPFYHTSIITSPHLHAGILVPFSAALVLCLTGVIVLTPSLLCNILSGSCNEDVGTCKSNNGRVSLVLPLDAQLMAQDGKKSLDLSHNDDIFSAAALSFF